MPDSGIKVHESSPKVKSSRFKDAGIRFRSRIQPRLVFDSPAVSWLLGVILLLLSVFAFSTRQKLQLLATATRRLETRGMIALGRRLLRPWTVPDKSEVWRRHNIGWGRYFGDFANLEKDKALTTSLLLKNPGKDGEKGVIYCSFEFNWMKLIANHDARKIFKDYILVGASSWSPSDNSVLANLCGLSDDPAFIGISNHSDIDQYGIFSPGIYPLPILACDWVDENDFSPVDHDKRSIDILMVSHFASWKRHWLLFDALRKMRRDLKVVLIGRNAPGRTERELREEAKAFGVRQELTILKNLEIDEVSRYQSNAKLTVALSKREGSCVSVTESMFANTPVAMMNDAHIGSRAYINQDTGRILDRKNLSNALSEMVERSGTFSSRTWAMKHISADLSSRKLNHILKQYCLGAGRPWTRDIAPLCWRYVPRYLRSEDGERLREGVERLKQKHGLELEEFVSERKALSKAS